MYPPPSLSFRFFGWSISYPTAAHFVGYYNANSFQSDGNVFPLPDLPLCLSSELPPEMDYLDCISAELDLMDPMNTLSELGGMGSVGTSGVGGVTPGESRAQEGMEGITDIAQRTSTGQNEDDVLSLHYQLEKITTLLLEKALRGIIYTTELAATALKFNQRTYQPVKQEESMQYQP